MSFLEEIQIVRNKIINRTLFVSAIFVCFVLAASLIRFIEIGWQPIYIFHSIIALTIISVFIFRNHISLRLKVNIFFLMFFAISVIGGIYFSLLGGFYFILVVISLATMMFGRKSGIFYAILFLISFAFIGILHNRNVISQSINFNDYINHKTTLIAHFIGYFYISLILVHSISLFYNFFTETIKSSLHKTDELSLVNKKLADSELKFRTLFESSKDGILMVDKDFKIIDFNHSYLQLTEYESSEILGHDYKELLPKNNINWDTFFLDLASKNGDAQAAKISIPQKNGRLIPIEVVPYKINYEDKTYLWGVLRDLREKERLENLLFSTMVSAEEEERERYAKELHDGLGPLISTSMIYIHTIKDEKKTDLIKDYAKRAYTILEEATSTIREISNNLSPLILKKYGVVQAIRSFIEKIRNATHIKFSINEELTGRFDETIEITLYRTLVELCNNSIKYSDAKNISINLDYNDELLNIVYRDDGKGFNYQESINKKSGFGLLNLENRIKKLGGQYIYKTSVGKGVQVNFWLKTNYV